jgi:hypothetical protein
LSVPARIVLGTDGSIATLQMRPDPRPGSCPCTENPAAAADVAGLNAPHPISRQVAKRAAASDRRFRRSESLAGGQESVG